MSTSPSSEALLDAGAVLRDAVDVAKDTIDTLTTRAYRHPVLGERTVVRLVPGTLGQAEDLTMEFLGFTVPETVAEVGVVRQQALGFPAWALVNDPANGHHALALVKDIERLVRVAKSRIGPARDGFNELGERLARSVPHFLPTFYEEAARAFLAADSQTYAASMFGKAREAERLYALKIDEDRQHTVFLEFALAGALTAKALSAHSRDLAGRSDPAAAYDRFRRLCLERTLGGMPPYAQMHVDLRRLAKAAKLSADEEDALLTELLTAPSIVRAPGGFWTAYRPVLIRIAQRDPKVRGQLLGMNPNDCPVETWLEILEESGAIAALTGPPGSVPAEAESPDGPAGWLARMDRHRGGWRRKRLAVFYQLAGRMADRLKADAVPVELCRGGNYIDLDLVDTVLALGVPLGEVPDNTRCAVDQWLADDADGRRELSEVAGHERLRPRMAESIEEHLRVGYRDELTVAPDRVDAVVAVPGLRTTLHWWLDQLAERVVHQGLTTVGAELDRLTLVSCPAGLAVNPEAIRRITEHELGPVLGRTLRTGVLDEFGWPALESAMAGLAPVDDTELQVLPQWPQLLVRAGDQVTIVGGDGVELEHVLRIPADQRRWQWRMILRYVDGQLLVNWDKGQERAGYWSGTADDVFITSDDAFESAGDLSVALPGGGRTAGGRPLHVGDRSSQERGMVATDGLHYWVLMQSQDDYQWRWREYDPATGAVGRQSLPAFFEGGAVDGQRLEQFSCRLLPASERLTGSPLGYRDGLVGWRLRGHPGVAQTGEAIDGRTFTLPEPGEAGRRGDYGRLVGAIRFPGSDTLHGMVMHDSYRNNRITLWTDDGVQFSDVKIDSRHGTFAEGTPLLPPPAYWHYLRPRDEAGSAALRVVTDDAAGQLLTAVAALAGGALDKSPLPDGTVRELVTGALPQLSDAALITGVAGIVKHATRAALRLARLTTATAAIAAEASEVRADPDADKPSDKLLDAALSGLIPSCYDHGHEAVKLFTHFGAALTGREPGQPLAPLAARADLDWLETLGAVPAVMHRAVSPVTPAEHRTALLDLLEILAGTGLLAPGGRTRRVQLLSETREPKFEVGAVVEVGDRRLAILRVDKSDGEARALEYAPGGRFGAVPGHSVGHEQVFDPQGITAEQVTAFVALARANGPVRWRPELVRTFSTAAGVSLAEATVLLAGPASTGAWEHGRPDGWQIDSTVTDTAIEAAIEHLRQNAMSPRSGVYATLLPTDAGAMAELWTGGPAPDRLAAWRAESVGVRTPVADDLIVEFRKAGVANGVTASEFLHGIANLDTCRWLAGPGGGVDNDDLLISVARALPWLVRRLPGGHPIRAGLPRLLELTRQRLREPGFTLSIGHSEQEQLEKFLRGLGGVVTRDDKQIDAGVFYVPLQGYWREIRLRPSRISGVDDPLLAAVIAFTGGPDRSIIAMRAILGDQLTNWIDAEATAGFAGAEHDPSRSAPALVAEVAERHGIGADAATLYLQLLALPDPTDRNVAGWTGWKPARLKAARAELAGTDLVVEAKRPRAGRSLFLPGGWLALGTPHLPLELWKLPLVIGDGENIHALGTIIPIAPAPQLFTLAWTRVTSGDHPRFEELDTKGRR
jgi:hypothetical protein